MLPQNWRLQAKNETGEDVGLVIRYQGVRYDTEGQIVYGSWSSDLGDTGILNDETHETTEQENTDGFLGLLVEVVATGTGTPDGKVVIHFQARGEGSGDWPLDESGHIVMVIAIDGTDPVRRVEEV